MLPQSSFLLYFKLGMIGKVLELKELNVIVCGFVE